MQAAVHCMHRISTKTGSNIVGSASETADMYRPLVLDLPSFLSEAAL